MWLLHCFVLFFLKENNQCYLAALKCVPGWLRWGVSIDSPWALAHSLPPRQPPPPPPPVATFLITSLSREPRTWDYYMQKMTTIFWFLKHTIPNCFQNWCYNIISSPAMYKMRAVLKTIKVQSNSTLTHISIHICICI